MLLVAIWAEKITTGTHTDIDRHSQDIKGVVAGVNGIR